MHDDHVIVRKVSNEEPRSKVAAFDLDGTLLLWSKSVAWPSQLSHYELWSSIVPNKLRQLHDEGYKLVLFTNQGGIQRAYSGKKATLVMNVIDWLASSIIQRPVHAVLSTLTPKKSDQSYHKPSSKMWEVAVKTHNQRKQFDISQSFYVGDSIDPDDSQGGVDLGFAEEVGKANGKDDGETTLKFFSPEEFFGCNDREQRRKTIQAESAPSRQTFEARAALLGGYLNGPIILLLCGVQGSGKSMFCRMLLDASFSSSSNKNNTQHWRCFSQDTINNGKPGKRHMVEEATKTALEGGHSVVVDRMHLDPDQREHFINIARSAHVPVHALVFNPSKDVLAQRVKNRTNHPGKVQGEDGARLALATLENKLFPPTYSEEIQLITSSSSDAAVTRMAQLYSAVGRGDVTNNTIPPPPSEFPFRQSDLSIPNISLGTMGMGKKTKKACLAAISAGIRAVDTAPTYKNEDQVGDVFAEMKSCSNLDVFCIAKVPKRATQPDQVRSELSTTLKKLKRSSVDLLLLHWPCDVIAAGTLGSVWKEMECCVRDGLCKSLGVCNFNVAALTMLLHGNICTIPPVVNQVERHPLLWELFDFCAHHNILLQAHTPLGHGKDKLFHNPAIERTAKEASISVAQTLIQWNLQHGVAVTPKCSKSKHAKELVKKKVVLSPSQMKALDSIDEEEFRRFAAPPFMFGTASYCWGEHNMGK